MWPTHAYGNPFLSDSESLKETRERKGMDEMKGILLYFFFQYKPEVAQKNHKFWCTKWVTFFKKHW